MIAAAALWVWGKAKVYIMAALGIFAWVGYAYLKGRREGSHNATERQQAQVDKVEDRWDEIDARRPDFDAAIDSLRNRSRQKR